MSPSAGGVTVGLTLASQRSVAHAHAVTYPVVVLVAAAAVWFCLGALTVVGLRHRGSATPVRVVATLLAFPATWTVWYVVDRRTLSRLPVPPTGAEAEWRPEAVGGDRAGGG